GHGDGHGGQWRGGLLGGGGGGGADTRGGKGVVGGGFTLPDAGGVGPPLHRGGGGLLALALQGARRGRVDLRLRPVGQEGVPGGGGVQGGGVADGVERAHGVVAVDAVHDDHALQGVRDRQVDGLVHLVPQPQHGFAGGGEEAGALEGGGAYGEYAGADLPA